MRLAWGPDVPDALVAMVEHHGRSIGLPLHVLEQMGASLDVAERFVLAAEQGLGLSFATSHVYGADAEPDTESVAPPAALEGWARLRGGKGSADLPDGRR